MLRLPSLRPPPSPSPHQRLKRVRVGGLRLPRELPLGKFWRLGPKELAAVHDRAKQEAPWATL